MYAATAIDNLRPRLEYQNVFGIITLASFLCYIINYQHFRSENVIYYDHLSTVDVFIFTFLHIFRQTYFYVL